MPQIAKHTDILREIKARSFQPLYLLHGEEPYFIDVLAKAFEADAVDPGMQGFNQTVLYGLDTSAAQIVDAASRYPMMYSHQLVLVKEAQDLADFKNLERYLDQPVPSTVLVFAYRGKKIAANTKIYKAILANGSVFESKALYDNQLPAFIVDWFKTNKRSLENGVADLLAEYLGNDLVVLTGALEKLLINVPKGQEVSTRDVETHVGISRQFNVFELQDALGGKQFERVIRIAWALSQNERDNPFPLTIASLYGFFAGLFAMRDVIHQSEAAQKEATGIHHPFRLGKVRQAAANWSREEIMAALLLLDEYDLKSKGVEYNPTSGGGDDLTMELAQRLVGVGVGVAG